MESSENNFPADNASEDVKAEVASLGQQLWTLLVLLLVVSGTLSIFLMREVTYARNDLATLKAQAAPFMQDFLKQEPGMNQFIQKMGEYGRTHPDFMPILNKYGFIITATPAPAPTPKK